MNRITFIYYYANSFIKDHIRSLYSDLDAAQELTDSNTVGFRSYNPHYLISFVLYLIIFLYGLFGLVWQQDPTAWHDSWQAILASPYSHHHSKFPRQIW